MNDIGLDRGFGRLRSRAYVAEAEADQFRIDDCAEHRTTRGVPGVFGHGSTVVCGTDNSGVRMLMPSNIFGVSAGRFALFRVVSRSQVHYFRSSRRFMRLVRFPAAPLRKSWSGPKALASFLFHQHPRRLLVSVGVLSPRARQPDRKSVV